MRKIILSNLIVFVIAVSGSSAQGVLEVSVQDVKSEKGNIMFLLFDRSEGFPSQVDHTYRLERIKAKKGQMVHYIKDIPFGTYALSICHDANENGEIDTNFVGFPKEKVGASNHSGFGKPSFSKAKFTLSPDQPQLSLNMKFLN